MATLDKKVTNLIKHWETKSPQNKSSASSVRLQSLSTQFEFGNHKQNDFSHLQRNLTMGNLNITLQKPVIDTTSQLKSTVFDGLSTQILIETPIRQKIYTHKYVPSNATFVKFASPSSVATTGSSSSKFRHLESSVFSTSVTSTEKRVWSSNTPSPVVTKHNSQATTLLNRTTNAPVETVTRSSVPEVPKLQWNEIDNRVISGNFVRAGAKRPYMPMKAANVFIVQPASGSKQAITMHPETNFATVAEVYKKPDIKSLIQTFEPESASASAKTRGRRGWQPGSQMGETLRHA